MKIKTFNQLSKIKSHIENKTFSLKDYEKTFKKYNGYKKDFVLNFFIEHKEDLNEFLNNSLKSFVFDSNKNILFFDRYKEIKNLNKSNINQFKTLINSLVYNENLKFIDGLGFRLNKNEIKNLTIIFYLKYYKKINSIMRKLLIGFYMKNFKILSSKNKEDFKNFLIINELSR